MTRLPVTITNGREINPDAKHSRKNSSRICKPASGRNKFSTAPIILARIEENCYISNMTQAVAHILDEVEQLSETERRELRQAFVQRLPVADDLTEDDFASLAAASFRALDEEESARA
jgi:hypothetical protein